MKGAVLGWTERCSMFETEELTTESCPMKMEEKLVILCSFWEYIGCYDLSVKPEPYSYLFSEVVEWLLLSRMDYRSFFHIESIFQQSI
jgi:hypothetical protein